jgi:hypothetical protein
MVINLPAAISWRRALELLRSSVECRTLYEFLPGVVGVLEKINVEHEVLVAGGAAGPPVSPRGQRESAVLFFSLDKLFGITHRARQKA